MDDYVIRDYLNNILNFGDIIDGTGQSGVYALTNGEYNTKDAVRLDLGLFLLYVASGNGVYTEEEVSLVNIAMGRELNSYQLKELESSVDAPDPFNCLSLMGFLSGDNFLNQSNGTRDSKSTDALIELFETFGNLMVAYDENAVSKARCAKYINGMKLYVMKNLK